MFIRKCNNYIPKMYLKLKSKIKTLEFQGIITTWDGMWESNPRMLEPQSNVLTTSPIPPVRL